MVQWDERADLVINHAPLTPILKQVMMYPVTETSEYFGKYTRVTKEQ